MRNKVIATLAGFGLMAGIVPTPAKAIPVTACSPSSLEVCAAVQYSVAQVGSQWQVTVYAWNLFGNAGFPGSLSSVITYVGLASPTWSGTFSVASATFGGSAVPWTAASGLPNNLGIKIDVAATETGVQNGLIGCNQTKQFSTQLQTCYSDLSKALKIVFNTSSQFTIGTGYWEVHGQEVNGSSCSLWWNSNGASTEDNTANCTNVVPEPITMTLLGTGLASMGGFGLLRRRRKGHDIEA